MGPCKALAKNISVIPRGTSCVSRHGTRQPSGAYWNPRNVMHRPILALLSATVLASAVSFAVPCFAQNSDFNLNMHANSHATAKDIGLPVYPGATPFRDKDSDSSSADLGLI